MLRFVVVKHRLIRLLPAPMVQLLRRIRASRPVEIAVQGRALAAVARASCPPGGQGRSMLDLAAVWSASDPVAWQHIQSRLDALGVRHNLGGINPGDRRAISALVGELKPERVLEIGTHIGFSTVTLAATLAENGSRITTVDVCDVNDPRQRLWEQYGMAHSPAELVDGLAPVEFVVSDSLSYLSQTSDRYDFIFLDGDHAANTVYRELPLALSRLTSDGVILMHDFFPQARRLWPRGELIVGPSLATDRLQREGYPVRIAPLGELPWPTKLGSCMTSLAVALGE